MEANTQYPPAVERALKILDLFMKNDAPKSVKEISAMLDIPTASAYRIIRCLADAGYLQEDAAQSGYYHLGYKIGIFARHCDKSISLVAAPFMEELAQKTNQACQLSVLSSDSVITIHQTLPSSTITVIADIGGKIPINISAAGKVLTAIMPPDKQKAFLDSAWKLKTVPTNYSIDKLENFVLALPEIAKKGYAIDFEEYALGIGCLAVPIFDKKGIPVAAIGLTGHIDNYRDEAIVLERAESLKKISRKISEVI